eukprot:820046_1
MESRLTICCGYFTKYGQNCMDLGYEIFGIFHSILSHKQPVRTMSWNNVNHKLQLAVSCNNDRLYLWSKSGSVVIRVVASRFNVRRVTWRPMRCNDENHSPRIRRRKYAVIPNFIDFLGRLFN